MTVENELSGNDSPIQLVVESLQRIGWLKKVPTCSAVINSEVSGCLLRGILSAQRDGCTFSMGVQQYALSQRGAARIRKLVEAGVALQTEVRPWQLVIDQWIGPRLYLSHAGNFGSATKYTSIVSSRMGRGRRNVPDWPERVDAALASSHRLAHRLLSCSGIASHEVVASAAATAGAAAIELEIATDSSPQQWLAEKLVSEQLLDCCVTTISISPPLLAPAGQSPLELNLNSTPLRDRAVIALADRVLGLSARRRGAIETLLRTRASDERFPAGTTYVAIRPAKPNPAQRKKASELLSDGVIGWLVEKRSVRSHGRFWSCRPATVAARAGMQVAIPMPELWRKLDAESWPFLSHCTRGTTGPRPLESEESFLKRCWVEGTEDSHPLLTLGEILMDETIRCNDVLYRNSRKVVSFSQVPLPDLLGRRKFQLHLGRWDWEPYGIAIRRSVLESLGARPVIYGDDATFDSLSESDRAFFQPSQRRNGRDNWSDEQEWRVLGDVRVGKIKYNEALIFVAHRQEALALCKKVRWPVVWTRD